MLIQTNPLNIVHGDIGQIVFLADIINSNNVAMAEATGGLGLLKKSSPYFVELGAFKFFGLDRAAKLTQQLGPLSAPERLEFLTERAPSRILPFLLRHRYLALLVVLNLPGNSIIGGGGGIALLAGISGIYRFPAFLLTVLLAVAPVPLVFLWTHSTF